jgi:hypothetical protein
VGIVYPFIIHGESYLLKCMTLMHHLPCFTYKFIYVNVDVAKLMILYAMNVCIHIWKCYMEYLFCREWLIENVNITLMYLMFNSSDNDFIEASLGGMGYSCRLYKKSIPNCKFIRGRFQNHNFLKINILQVVMFQIILINYKISKEKQIF